MNHGNITDIATYQREHTVELGARILEIYPPLQSTKDPVAPRIATLLRKALPAQALAITGTAKYPPARTGSECEEAQEAGASPAKSGESTAFPLRLAGNPRQPQTSARGSRDWRRLQPQRRRCPLNRKELIVPRGALHYPLDRIR
jgi:hypothetical protein